LVRGGLLNKPEAKRRFLDCFQVWSNHFQKMVLTRAVTVQNPVFEELAWCHLIEELGHNRDLAKNRGNLQSIFDPVLESSCAWFPWKTSLITDAEKVVLIHLVVEASATFFYKHIQPAMASSDVKEHFDVHKVADDGHVEMGCALLRKLPLADGQVLFEIQRQGWAMLSSLMGRIADLVVHHSDSKAAAAQQQEHSDADTALAV
jgi:hypothetical protein